MRRCFHFLAAALLLVLSASSLAGDACAGKVLNPSKESIQPDAGDMNSPTAVLMSTGFEAADGFVLGPLEPQLGWTASGVNLPWVSVSALNPGAGARHVRIIKDATVGAGSGRVFLSPVIAQPPNTPSQFKGLIYISNDGGADYDFFGQAPSQAFITWRVKFSFADAGGAGPGTIFILDDVGFGPEFIDTGVLWTQGAYEELKVQFDPAAGEIRYFYAGVQIYTGVIYAGTAVEQIGGLTDNFQLAGEHGGYDAITLLDTPSDPVTAQPTSWGAVKGLYR